MDENKHSIQPTLEEVKDKLDNWRKIKRNHREPIPKDLWQAATELARKHSINTVSKALRLSYADLKERVCPSKHKPANKENAPFIEFECNSPLTAEETTLELQDLKRDLRLKISFKGSPGFDIATLIKYYVNSKL